MNHRMDRSMVSFESFVDHAKKEKEYWNTATIDDKLRTVTYLRECLYGPEATTGRLQRFFNFFKLK